MKKAIYLFLAIVFILFASLQLNDPDPTVWVSAYGFIALMALMAFFGRFYRWVLLGGMGMGLVWAALLLPAVWEWVSQNEMKDIFHTMSPDKVFIEEAREFLGLLLAVSTLYFLYRQGTKKNA